MKTLKNTLFTLIFVSLNLSASNIATITALKGTADVQRNGTTSMASIGTKLGQKDTVLTKENSKIQIIFKDETVVSIGKNSKFSIAEYIFEDNTPPIAKFNMIRGAMRTITGQIGNIAPQRFSVATKTATIGIRGTNFSIFVDDDGSSSAFCTYGAISVDIAGATHVVQQGFYITLSSSTKVEIKEFTPAILKKHKEKYFGINKKQKDILVRKDSAYEKALDSDNSAQLDVRINDTSGMIITDISDDTRNVILHDESIFDNGSVAGNPNTSTPAPDLATLLAGYTMTNALYTGNYLVTDAAGGDTAWVNGSTGEAELLINFAADTANLSLTDVGISIKGSDTGYSTNTFSGTGFTTTNNSIADNVFSGTFSGSTGENITGNFSVDTSGSKNDLGTYSVSVPQALN